MTDASKTTGPLAGLELRYHGAMPNRAKVLGLDIRAVPECEGGGFMLRRDQAEAIVSLVRERATATRPTRHAVPLDDEAPVEQEGRR